MIAVAPLPCLPLRHGPCRDKGWSAAGRAWRTHAWLDILICSVRVVGALLCGLGMVAGPAHAQVAAPSAGLLDTQELDSDSPELDAVIRSLFGAIESLSDYRAGTAMPQVFQWPQLRIEAKVCDTPCNVTAAYVPREGIYLAENLDPVREPLDRAALLHELVHYLQRDHPRFARMTPCQRSRAQEQEAYAIQNAYLAMIGSSQRVTFYDGEFDCKDG
jgi:Domain of unknown function (DUF6647)